MKGRWRALGFVVLGSTLFVIANATLYYPHSPDSWFMRGLESYLRLLAGISGWLISCFDPDTFVTGRSIHGRFPLQIVLECTALDAQAALLAFTLAYPSSLTQKLMGTLGGMGALWIFNLVRIVLLYFVGAYWPSAFSSMHEEVLALAIIGVALLSFVVWLEWLRRSAPQSRTAENAVA